MFTAIFVCRACGKSLDLGNPAMWVMPSVWVFSVNKHANEECTGTPSGESFDVKGVERELRGG